MKKGEAVFTKQGSQTSCPLERRRRSGCDLDKALAVLSTLTGVDVDSLSDSPPSKHLRADSCRAAETALSSADTNASRSPSSSPSSYSLPSASKLASGLDFREVKGDLFSAPSNFSLAHCVSADFRMGKGIATLFKQKFGGVDELRNQNRQVGQVAVLSRCGRHIYYLISKERYWQKPTYNSLRQCLVELRNHMLGHAVHQLAIPRLGCGLDGLLWKKVQPMIVQVFSGEPRFEIRVYCL